MDWIRPSLCAPSGAAWASTLAAGSLVLADHAILSSWAVILILGAQGVRSLSVMLVPRNAAEHAEAI